MRFDPRYTNICINVVVSGAVIIWVMSSSYLAAYFDSCSKFKVSIPQTKLNSTCLLTASSEKMALTHPRRFCLQ